MFLSIEDDVRFRFDVSILKSVFIYVQENQDEDYNAIYLTL